MRRSKVKGGDVCIFHGGRIDQCEPCKKLAAEAARILTPVPAASYEAAIRERDEARGLAKAMQDGAEELKRERDEAVWHGQQLRKELDEAREKNRHLACANGRERVAWREDRDSLRAEVESLRRKLAQQAMETERRGAEALDHAIRAEKLRARLAAVEEALVWCSGASDFAPEGKARVGFERLVLPLLKTLAPAPAEPPCSLCEGTGEIEGIGEAMFSPCPNCAHDLDANQTMPQEPSSPLAAPEAAEARDYEALTGGKKP